MAIHMMLVAFGANDPSTDNAALLKHCGWNPETEGRTIDGAVEQYQVETEVPGVKIRIVSIMDRQIAAENVTVVFENAFPEELSHEEYMTRIDKIEAILQEFYKRISLPEDFNTTYYNLNGDTAVVLPGMAGNLTAALASSRKEDIKAQNETE